MKPVVSVVMCVKDVEQHIGECIESLLHQTFEDFEVIIVGDASGDRTSQIIKRFGDMRIRYFENEANLGIARSRNRGLRHAKGEYIFFTDGDCTASKNWIEEGLKFLKNGGFVGVEGKICYVSENHQKTFSDHVSENKFGGQFMTGNVAYKKSVVESMNGFDENLTYFEDRDLALRAARMGKIDFNPSMIVYAQKQTMTPKNLLKSVNQIKNRVRLFRKHRERELMIWRCVKPRNLARAAFPPFIFVNLLFHRFRTRDDFNLLPFTYVFAVRERVQLWQECARQKVFLF